MSNVDVAALVAELRPLLVGSRFDKAYQPAKDQVLLRFRRTGLGRLDLLVELGRFVTLTRRPPENPATPSMVAKILRSTYANGRVVGVHQIGFDRLLRIDVEKAEGVLALVVELFGDGNLLLLDAAGTILLPMRGEEYAHRRLKRGEPYVPPPSGPQPLDLDLPGLEVAAADARKDVVRFLALDLGFGPLWAEELCLRADVDKKRSPGELDGDAWSALHGAIQALAADIRRNDLAPAVVVKDGEPVDAVPFPMRKYPAPEFALEEAPSFHEALETFFLGAPGDEEEDDPRRARYEEAVGKVQRQVDQMQDAIGRFEAEEEEERADGDALYAAFQRAQALLDGLRTARAERSWDEVEATLRAGREAGHPAAMQVQEIRPRTGEAVLRLDTPDGPRDVGVDLRLNVHENADRHYEAAKRARSRGEGAAKALSDAEARLAEIEAKGLEGFGAAPQRVAAQRRHFWFETYRWTVTPHGLLAVGGRNAAQNDAVVKKYLRDGDRYVHAEIHGAPSVVVRPADDPPSDVPEEDLRTACQFAACSSRAWRQFGAASAYWVTAQQVSKTPRSGEFVPRGAWIVHGRRHTLSDLPMEWTVGRLRFRPNGRPVPRGEDEPRAVEKIAGGPPDGLAPFVEDAVRLVPGDLDPNEAAVRLAERFGVDVEAVQQALPPGPVRFVEGAP